MRDLFRFLYRQRNNLLFLGLLLAGLWMTVRGNMHQRAEWISSSNAVIGSIYGLRNGVVEFADLRQKNLDLLAALARERERNSGRPMGQDSLKVGTDTIMQVPYRYIPAQVINSTVHKVKNYLTLDKGTLDGVERDMAVIGADGIVGIVREASPHFASVISVLNEDHQASAQIKGTRHFGFLRWTTGDPRTVSLADIDKHVPIHVGDTVETRGSEGVYPPGVPVGVVSSVENDPSIPFHVITVQLSEDLTRSGYVHIVANLMRAERDTLEASAPVQ